MPQRSCAEASPVQVRDPNQLILIFKHPLITFRDKTTRKIFDGDPTRYAVRVNDQWRITFEWHEDNNAYDVYFEDYR